MQDLQEVTQEIHYENFRSEKIATGNVARKIKLVDRFIVPILTFSSIMCRSLFRSLFLLSVLIFFL